MLKGVLHFSPSVSGKLNVVLQRGTGTIRGTVTDKQSRPVAGVEIALVPDERGRLDLYKTAISGTSGEFALVEVPPGDYRLFSWEALAPNSYYDPEVLARYELQGQAVRVANSSSNTVQISVIAAEP